MIDRISHYQQLIDTVNISSFTDATQVLNQVYDSLCHSYDMRSKIDDIDIEQVVTIFLKQEITEFINNILDVDPRVFLLAVMKYMLMEKRYPLIATKTKCLNEIGLLLRKILRRAYDMNLETKPPLVFVYHGDKNIS